MAVSSHLTANLKQEPSIFELFAAEFLDRICYPAFSRIFKFIENESKLNLNISVLLSTGIVGSLQFFYLQKYSSSFGESFYGLQRANIANYDIQVSMKKKLLSAIVLILPQYIEIKYGSKISENCFLVKTMSNVVLLYNGLKMVQTLAYMMHLVSTHSPLLWLLRLKLCYPENLNNNDKTMFILFKAFEFVAFFLQFTQWWYSKDYRKYSHSLRKPTAFKKNSNVGNGNCPICLQPLDTPTANSITGLVYCWKCVSGQINSHAESRSSKNNLQTDFKDLIRIFEA